jgi:hypothetical protein
MHPLHLFPDPVFDEVEAGLLGQNARRLFGVARP